MPMVTVKSGKWLLLFLQNNSHLKNLSVCMIGDGFCANGKPAVTMLAIIVDLGYSRTDDSRTTKFVFRIKVSA